jgi:hypothetical protein
VDGGQAPGSVVTYEVNDEGQFVNTETGEEYPPGPDLAPHEETMPDWLWSQHAGTTEDLRQEADL